jgi:hypothetical protein
MRNIGIKLLLCHAMHQDDSCDKNILVFKDVFKDSYVDIAVGKKIAIK